MAQGVEVHRLQQPVPSLLLHVIDNTNSDDDINSDISGCNGSSHNRVVR